MILPWHRRSSYEPDAPARGVPQSPRWRVGLVCARMRNFLAGVIPKLFLFAPREVPERSSAMHDPVVLTEPNARKGARRKRSDLLDVSVIVNIRLTRISAS